MIASYSQNFIFVKTRKTSGTSAEIVMSAWCSGRDICTPISPEDEVERQKLGGKAMNHRRWLIRQFYNHMPADEIARKLPELWEQAFKFTLDRHPYEKAVSLAAYKLGAQGDYDEGQFRSTLDRVISERTYLNYPLYMRKDALAVDQLYRFDNFWSELKKFAEVKKLPFPNEIPKAKSKFKKPYTTAKCLSTAQMKIIREDAAVEFELLGWDK